MDFWLMVAGFVGLIILILLLNRWYCMATISNETITVSDKGIVVDSVGTGDGAYTVSHHMIYTTNGQALKNTNNIWFWKFHSDELQGKLKKGKKYRIKTWGVRVAWLGMYKHIISATEVKVSSRKKNVKKSK
ncbi:MAG: hypothetical protein E7006_03175 [Alphaproteobacteria bacterium]|nr:hypothetical protein [Alphaproteobacteria bacterium]